MTGWLLLLITGLELLSFWKFTHKIIILYKSHIHNWIERVFLPCFYCKVIGVLAFELLVTNHHFVYNSYTQARWIWWQITLKNRFQFISFKFTPEWSQRNKIKPQYDVKHFFFQKKIMLSNLLLSFVLLKRPRNQNQQKNRRGINNMKKKLYVYTNTICINQQYF